MPVLNAAEIAAALQDQNPEAISAIQDMLGITPLVAEPDPAPIFGEPPSISPVSGTAGVTEFTANDGTVSHGTVTGRRWLLNGTSVGTGTTVVPMNVGALVLEVTAAGPGGETTDASLPADILAVSTPSLAYVPASGYEGDILQSATYASQTVGTVTGLELGYSISVSGGLGLFSVANVNEVRLTGSVNFNVAYTIDLHINLLNASGVIVGSGIDRTFTVVQGAVASPRWVTMLGSGTKDGTSFENAAPLAQIASQVANSGQNGVVNIVEGEYTITAANLATVAGTGSTGTNQTLVQSTDSEGTYKPLGVKPFGMRRMRNGTLWELPDDPEQLTYLDEEYDLGGSPGNTFITVQGSRNLTFRGFDLSHFNFGWVVKNSTNMAKLVWEDCKFLDVQRFIEQASGSTVAGMTVRNCTGIGCSRAAVRCNGTVTDLLIEDFPVNAGRQIGDSTGTVAWQEIFDLTGTITNWTIRGTETDPNSPNFMHLKNCSMDPRPIPGIYYQNGDGITGNENIYNGLVENVRISGMTDAGIDNKGRKTHYRNVICEDNKRNWRCWIVSILGEDPWQTFENCKSINPTTKRNPPHASGTIPIHWGIYDGGIGRADMLWMSGCEAIHDPALPGCAGAVLIGVEGNSFVLRVAHNGLKYNGQWINTQADREAYSGDGSVITGLTDTNAVIHWDVNLANTAKAVVPTEQRSAVMVENSAFSRQFVADRPFTMRVKVNSQYGTVARDGLFVGNQLYLNYNDLGGSPATINFQVLSPERNKDEWTFSINVLDDGVVVGDELTFWIAPTARGAQDGSSYANAANRTAIPTFIKRGIQDDVPVTILVDADSGDYQQQGNAAGVIDQLPTNPAKGISLRGMKADGLTPRRAKFKGNRPNAANGSTGGTGPNWLRFENLSPGSGYIWFYDIDHDHYGNGVWLVTCPIEHWGVFNHRSYNVYRTIENTKSKPADSVGDTTDRDEGAARISHFECDNIELLRAERGFAQLQYGVNHVTMSNMVLDGDSRWGKDWQAMLVFKSQRADGLDEWSDITLNNVTCKNSVQVNNAVYNNGDGIDADSGKADNSQGPRRLVINTGYFENCADAGLDHKALESTFNDVHIKWCKRALKDWGNTGFNNPNTYNRLTIEEPRRPTGVNGSNDAMFFVGLNVTNQRVIFNDSRMRCAASLCRTFLDYKASTQGGIRLEVNGWDKWEIPDDMVWIKREGGVNTGGATIYWDPQLPTSEFTIVPKPGFNGLVVPQGTAVGTAIGTIVFAEGSGFARIVSGSPAFTIDQTTKEIRVASALSYSTQPIHEFTVRGVYGIFGINPLTGEPGDIDDPKTWQCYMGPTFKEKTVVVAIHDGSNENAATTAFMTSFGSAAPSTQWRRFVDMFQNSLDELNLRTKQDVFVLGYGWNQEVAVRDALNRHHGVIEGSITWEAATGSFKSAGSVSTNRVNWPTYAPASGGEGMLRDSVTVMAEIMEDVNTGNTQFSVAGVTNLVPRTSGSSGTYRVTAAAARSYNLPNSGASMGRAWWRLLRNSSSVMQLYRAGTAINTSSIASVALSTGTQWGGANQNKGFLRCWGAALVSEDVANVYKLYARAAAMVSQFV
ncbi:cadherin repeat domain-containing protein [Sphingobium phenoxybenzoativorans]|uniref:cadherin repeat domain-containing protein n=1 Tax=Sphingobium phenoxybenzoativorans TaxID=1592790 RepID=UPI000872C89A|nr:cadherin repeat domain-containing protein [Sphingobium phenoxybenzoativorans]